MAKQRTKSAEQIYNQYQRAYNTATALRDSGKISEETFRTRTERIARTGDRYLRNIESTPSYQKTKNAFFNRNNASGDYSERLRAMARDIQKASTRQYSRSTYMGGVRRASGSKG